MRRCRPRHTRLRASLREGSTGPTFDPNTPGASDLIKDPYGGYVTPTAFSKYWQAWVEEQPHSAFDDTIMTGDEEPLKPGYHWELHHDKWVQVLNAASLEGYFDDELGQTTTEDASPACPPGWHWEERGSVLICQPNVHGHDYGES